MIKFIKRFKTSVYVITAAIIFVVVAVLVVIKLIFVPGPIPA